MIARAVTDCTVCLWVAHFSGQKIISPLLGDLGGFLDKKQLTNVKILLWSQGDCGKKPSIPQLFISGNLLCINHYGWVFITPESLRWYKWFICALPKDHEFLWCRYLLLSFQGGVYGVLSLIKKHNSQEIPTFSVNLCFFSSLISDPHRTLSLIPRVAQNTLNEKTKHFIPLQTWFLAAVTSPGFIICDNTCCAPFAPIGVAGALSFGVLTNGDLRKLRFSLRGRDEFEISTIFLNFYLFINIVWIWLVFFCLLVCNT